MGTIASELEKVKKEGLGAIKTTRVMDKVDACVLRAVCSPLY